MWHVLQEMKIMKMKNKNFITLSLIIGLLFSCSSDEEDFSEKTEIQENNFTPTPTTVATSELDVENFFYRGMSDIYLYKKDVAVLADDHFDSSDDKTRYLKNF